MNTGLSDRMRTRNMHMPAFDDRSLILPPANRIAVPGCLKTDIEKSVSAATPEKATRPDSAVKDKTDRQRALLCSRCLHPITSRQEETAVNGRHTHVFANPGGMVFEVGCFRSASGCGHAGLPTLEFTWFDGYAWQVAVCSGCVSHIGWYYTSSDGSFYGLILNRLIDTQ